MANPVLLQRRFTWPSSIESVWALISNTDAFNRAAGLGLRFKTEDGRWRGNQKLGPLTVTWDEHPMEFEEPNWFRSHRAYDNGPIASITATARLTESGEGTTLDYQIELVPRSFGLVFRTLGPTLIALSIDKGLAAVGRALTGDAASFDAPPPLPARVVSHIDQALRGLEPAYRDAILNRLENAPILLQHQLRPLQIAREDGLDGDRTTLACLTADVQNVLQLSWHLICPRCRGAGARLDMLSLAARQVHCDTCDIQYNATLADNIEAVFQPHPSVRADVPVVDCVMSPSRTPHILAQFFLAAEGRAEFEVVLQTGSYRLECAGMGLLVDVDADYAEQDVVVVEYRGERLAPSVVRVPPGPVRLVVFNREAVSVPGHLARRWRAPDALTASRLLARDGLRDAAYVVELCSQLDSRAYHGVGVIVDAEPEHLQKVYPLLAKLEVRHEQLSERTLALGMTEIADALEMTSRLVGGGLPIGVGLAAGLILELTDGTHVQICGEAIEAALDAVRRVGVPQVSIPESSIDAFRRFASPMVRIRSRGGEPAVIAFASVIDGAPTSERPRPAEPPSAPEGLPEHVSGYTVLRELDRGGMGRVLEAIDPRSGERCAIKLKLHHIRDERVTQGFFREAFYAQQIHHPNVVRLYDWGEYEGRPFIVMECLIGRSLMAEMRVRRKIDPVRTREILVAVLNALHAIHSVGLVHRDVKPHNIFVLTDPEAAPGGIKLLDFGLMRREGRSTLEGFAGTPAFAAPEQVVLDANDARTDLFSCAIVGYFLLTGTLPYRGDTRGQRALGSLDDHREAVLADARLGLLAPVLAKAMSPDPDDRYGSAVMMISALRALQLPEG